MAKDKTLRVTTPIGIAAFANLWQPFKFADQPGQRPSEPMFRLTLVYTKQEWASDEAKELRKAVQAALQNKFGNKLPDMLKRTGKSALSLPWRPVSDFAEYGEPFTTTPGGMVITLKSRDKPGIVGPDTCIITDPQEAYSGMRARATAGVWPFDTNGNQGCSLLLNNVQKAGEGKRLSGRPDPTKDFGGLDEQDAGGGGGDDNDMFA
jgi:hypothetical protein